ncbi:MAG: IS630 family transposase [Bacteroidetes bacterium]|nr:IS630 family transposase [Bacteroidota bacterium]
MEKQDVRKLDQATQEALRKQAMKLRSQGRTTDEVALIIGVHSNTVRLWHRNYKRKGLAGIKSGQRGRKEGESRKLTPDQEETIKKLITDKAPDQYKLSYALWTRQAIVDLIKQQFEIKVPVRTMGDYLLRWGFTPQKPLKRAYEQNAEAVAKWEKETYPDIKAKAKAEKAEIHWGDETGIRNDSQQGRSYAPKGKTPVIRLSAKRASANMISTVTNEGKVRFMIYEGSFNADMMIKFLKQLIKGADKKLILILDNLRVHHSNIVKTYLEEVKDKLEVFFLPSYSPELNPDEYLNNDLKQGVHSRPPSRTQEQLIKKMRSHMIGLQKSPSVVKNFFMHHRIRYAA